MRQLKRLLAVLVLTSALAFSAQAGVMETGVASANPAPAPTPSSTSTPSQPVLCGVMETGLTCGEDDDDSTDALALLYLLTVIQSVMPPY